MKRKRLFSLVLACMMAVCMVTGCGSVKKGKQADGSDGKITVGTMPLTVGVPVQYAYDKGYYEEEGLDVEIVIFSTGAPINEAFAAGQLDIAASGLASVYSLASAGAKWVGEINTTGGMGIYVRPDSEIAGIKGEASGSENIYGSADTVKGSQILGPLGTTAQFNANGKEYDDATLKSEIEVRDYMTGASLSADGFVFGKGMTEIATFFTEDGKIEKENLPNVQKSYDVSFIEEALGITITVDK